MNENKVFLLSLSLSLNKYEKALGVLPVCARETLGILDGELDFSSFRR